VVITRKREIVRRYLDYLKREIDLLAAALPSRRRVAQCHWGGGTPTYLEPDQMETLFAKLAATFRFEPDAELAIEVDPRVTTDEQLALLRRLGFNRVSLGVQDFDEQVQTAIGRHQTEEQTKATYETCRELGFGSINFDLVYGLPHQTADAFTASMQRVIELRPDRLALYSFAWVPWLKPHQKRLDKDAMPTGAEKIRLFGIARESLLGAGYRPVGMDHFALPDDEMVLAQRRRTLHRNFMGYTVRAGTDMTGLGLSSIGDVRGGFAQNAKKLPRYYEAIDDGRLPIERGYALNEDDLLRRAVITELMCNFYVDRGEMERRFGIEFGKYFATELAELSAPGGPLADGLIEIDDDRLEVTGSGRLLVRNLCMVFDRYLRKAGEDKPVYSRTI
jgi:oxygen-independent coproporphyrinogen-3 oxidase